MAALRTKSAYDKSTDGDGLRVLVMRFWPRGVRKDAVDVWLKDLGPEPSLIKKWKSGKINWAEFRKGYLSEYLGEVKKKAVSDIKSLLKSNKTITLLCGCKDEEHCHRTILKHMLFSLRTFRGAHVKRRGSAC
ncbi:MAG: DUF488 family protein [Deltaproteobacteria bacterium]|nr:DUF488 family protein [Deltaproteobacteria bacterium]